MHHIKKVTYAGAGMNSTIHPRRRRPMPSTIKPQNKATVVAIWGAGQAPGCFSLTCAMILATSSDMTATGPMETSLEVAKNCGAGSDHGVTSNMVQYAYAVDEDTNEARV